MCEQDMKDMEHNTTDENTKDSNTTSDSVVCIESEHVMRIAAELLMDFS